MAERWKGPYLKPGTKLEDPWGHKLRYEIVDRSGADNKAALPYKLSSIGPDGQPDTDDDIRISTESDTSGGTASAKARTWWAFQPVQKPSVPGRGHGNPIDTFIDEKLAAAGLKKAPRADKRLLLRRATFALTP